MSLPASLLVGLVLSSLIGFAAYLRGSLTPSGVVGAILTGTVIFGFGGFIPGLLLVAFFVSSSWLSYYKARAKEQFSEKFQKGSQRDFGQAIANGGWAALVALAYSAARLLQENAHVEIILFAAFVGAIAAVTADTWATELGVLSPTPPRLITSGRVVPAGTSGGISLLGTVTALLGGAFIGAVVILGAWIASLFHQVSLPFNALDPILGKAAPIILIASGSGLGGALFDSLLGATVQGVYFCEYDEVQTEKKIHTCGRATRLVRGWRWLDNDIVNFTASVFGSLIATLLANFVL
ncbi:MAG TPA: DUF92 domain-containing protein [Anaerolineae bacterium]|nr:DUF92 domain-containing protein [Anaerolineae bacterium]